MRWLTARAARPLPTTTHSDTFQLLHASDTPSDQNRASYLNWPHFIQTEHAVIGKPGRFAGTTQFAVAVTNQPDVDNVQLGVQYLLRRTSISDDDSR